MLSDGVFLPRLTHPLILCVKIKTTLNYSYVHVGLEITLEDVAQAFLLCPVTVLENCGIKILRH